MQFDVFLSHNSVDKPAVRHIRDALAAAGTKCWLDESDLRSGDDWMSRLEKGLAESRCCALFYGPSGLGPWHELERQLAQQMAAEAWRDGRRFGLIPVRLPGAPEWRQLALPPFLRLYTSVDFPSLSDTDALRRLNAGIRQEVPPPEAPDASSPPYIGMRPYLETDSAVYTGRTNYILELAEFLQRKDRPRLLAVLGASGSGKSSLLNAGLLPHLRQGTLHPETKSWAYVTMRPGSDAWSNLRAAIAGHKLLQPLIGLAATAPEKWLHEVASAACGTQHGAPRLVLIVDQFEELLTAMPHGPSEADEKRRADYREKVWRPFVQNLSYAVRETSGPVVVLMAMRSDFLEALADDPDLGPLLQDSRHRCLVLPLSEMEVRATIERPAVARGLKFDAALVEAVTQDYLLDPAGALPFLQEALLRVWEKGDRKELTLANYRGFGGLRGAVNAHATAVLEKLPPERAALVRPLFVHLTRLSDDGEPDTKRRRPLTDLPGGDAAQALARELAGAEHRLLMFDDAASDAPRDATTPAPEATVEIAHESLLAGWQDLKRWLQEKRPERMRLRRLESTARAWHEDTAEARPGLLRGAELRSAVRISTSLSAEVPPSLSGYLQSSRRAHLWWQARALALGLLVVGAIAGVAIWGPRGSADAQKQAELRSLHRQLAEVVKAAKFDAPTADVLTRKILALDPHDAATRETRARALLELGEYTAFAEEIALWRQSTQSPPATMEAMLGEASARQKQWPQAVAHWTAYLKAPGLALAERQRIWRKLVDIHAQLGQWEEAREIYRAWIDEADGPEPRAGRIAALAQLQDWKGRDADIDWLRQNHPDAAETKKLPTMANRTSVQQWEERATASPQDAKVWLGWAVELTRAREFSAALEKIEMAQRFDQDSPRLAIEAAHLHWQLEKPIPEELAVVADSGWTRDAAKFSTAHEAMQRRLEALSAVEARREHDPDQAAPHVELGQMLARFKQPALALECFRTALSKDPNSSEAQQGLAASQRALDAQNTKPPAIASPPPP